MPKYLNPTDPGAFDDWTLKKPSPAFKKVCPRCSGYGGWNLTLNAYGLHPGMEDTQENRHRFSHFRAMCDHCSGWGYVHESNQCAGHEWKFVENLGRCYNRYECINCHVTSDVDSGD